MNGTGRGRAGVAVEVSGLAKSFGATRALAGVDLAAEPGRVLALLGPNGAGKTTLVRIIATLLRPDAGPVFLLIFASSVFVPIATMPGWLQAFAKAQPVTVTVNTVRALTEGGAVAHWAWQSGCWIVAFIAVFGALSVRRYRAT
jgi:ABC-type Mn2+/Zn2+ transport system ATPase subunit